MRFSSHICVHTTQFAGTNLSQKDWGKTSRLFPADNVSMEYKCWQEKVKLWICLEQSEQGSSVGEVSGRWQELQSRLVWLPHLVIEWQGVRHDHSRVKVYSSRTQIMRAASACMAQLPLRFSSSAAWQKQPCVEYRLSKWISAPPYQARPLNY